MSDPETVEVKCASCDRPMIVSKEEAAGRHPETWLCAGCVLGDCDGDF